MPKRISMRIGQKIQVENLDDTQLYNSSIQDIKSNMLSIAMPYHREHPLILLENDEVRVRFATDEFSCVFKTRVLGMTKENIALYHLAYPTEVTKIQQRMHFRLSVNLDVQYALVPQRESDGGQAVEYREAVSVNISGGGMQIATRELLQENDVVVIKFQLPLKDSPWPMRIFARVVRVLDVENAPGLYHVGLKFEDIDRQMEDKIVRYTFEKMTLQKRLL